MSAALDDLERFLQERTMPLLVQLALAHHQFEVIHPFLDGNGRSGRSLIPLVLREALPHQMRNRLQEKGNPNSVVRLAEHLFAPPVVSPARVEALLGVTRPTAHAAIDALVERGDLVEVAGRDRGRIYEAPRIFDAIYGPIAAAGDEPDRRRPGETDPRR